jgi:hypothetical protein
LKPHLLSAFLVVLTVCAAAGADLRFEAPTLDRPHYSIRLAFEVTRSPVAVTEVRVNGTSWPAALIFRDGKLADKSKPLPPGTYDVVLDYAWASGKRYVLKIFSHGEKQAEPAPSEHVGMSPRAGGIPSGCEEGLARVYRVREEAGLERAGETCFLTLTALKAELGGAGLRLFDSSEEIPYQIVERKDSPQPEAQPANAPVETLKLAFLMGAKPGEKKLLVVLKGGSPRPLPQELSLTGSGLGKTLTSPNLVLQFHPQSGQILNIEYPKEGIRLWNKAGVIHWNPDVFIPGVAWDHSFDWNPPQTSEEIAGGLVYLSSRRGPLPRIKDVTLEVRYLVDSSHPFFIVETRLSVEKDLGVIAVRNDEMVLWKELFDTLMYRDKDGRVVTLTLKEQKEAPFGLVHVAPTDIPWAGLVNSKKGYGFFSLRLAAAAASLGPAGDFHHKEGTYFYAPSDGDYVYWVRPLLYTWGDYTTNSLLTFVPKGSFFYEKNAYLLVRMTDRTPETLDTLLGRLRNPLRVF